MSDQLQRAIALFLNIMSVGAILLLIPLALIASFSVIVLFMNPIWWIMLFVGYKLYKDNYAY